MSIVELDVKYSREVKNEFKSPGNGELAGKGSTGLPLIN